MQNNILIFLIVLISGFSQLALAEEINVTDTDYVGNLTLNHNTNVSHLIGEPGVMVVKYADTVSYNQLENPTDVNHRAGEPGVMVVKYADTVSYNLISGPLCQLDCIRINTISSELAEKVYVSISVIESIEPKTVSPYSIGVAACATPITLTIAVIITPSANSLRFI